LKKKIKQQGSPGIVKFYFFEINHLENILNCFVEMNLYWNQKMEFDSHSFLSEKFFGFSSLLQKARNLISTLPRLSFFIPLFALTFELNSQLFAWMFALKRRIGSSMLEYFFSP